MGPPSVIPGRRYTRVRREIEGRVVTVAYIETHPPADRSSFRGSWYDALPSGGRGGFMPAARWKPLAEELASAGILPAEALR